MNKTMEEKSKSYAYAIKVLAWRDEDLNVSTAIARKLVAGANCPCCPGES